MEINAYQDGSDFVVVFKNCHPNQKKLLETLLSPQMFEEGAALPEPPEQKDTILGYGRYKNDSAEEVLEREGDKGYANIHYMIQKGYIAEEKVSDIKEVLSSYVYERVSAIEDAYKYAEKLTPEDCKLFIQCFSCYMNEAQKESVAQQGGYASFAFFIEHAGETQLRSFAACLIEKMQADLL